MLNLAVSDLAVLSLVLHTVPTELGALRAVHQLLLVLAGQAVVPHVLPPLFQLVYHQLAVYQLQLVDQALVLLVL